MSIFGVCINDCSQKGTCSMYPEYLKLRNGYYKCKCNRLYTGADCSVPSCPKGPDWFNSSLLTECSGIGICKSFHCACPDGFGGDSCQKLLCPVDPIGNRQCNGKGKCVALDDHAKLNKIYPIFDYDFNWDSERIFGCECDNGFSGYDCSIQKCAVGLDPIKRGKYKPVIHIYEKKRSKFRFFSNGVISKEINHYTSINEISNILESFGYGEVSVIYSSSNNQYKFTFENPQTTIPSQLYTIPINSLIPIQLDEWNKSDAIISECNGRGKCIKGSCKCDSSFYPSSAAENLFIDNCGYFQRIISNDDNFTCPYNHDNKLICSGNGVCESEFKECKCNEGYEKYDCSSKICPSGYSWFNYPNTTNNVHYKAICSSRGICDENSGKCVCQKGFSGDACDKMDCMDNCNNHGECLTVNEYNHKHGLPIKDSFENENIRKCFCEKGYKGNSCNERECMYGVDKNEFNYIINKYGDKFEKSAILNFKCSVVDNNNNNNKDSLRLYVNSNIININIDTNLNDLKYKLLSESGLKFDDDDNNLEIKSNTKSSVCVKDGNEIEIIFPPSYCVEELKIYFEYDMRVFNISNYSFTSDKKCYECSNRGICDVISGKCKCFNGYGVNDDGIDNCGKEIGDVVEDDL